MSTTQQEIENVMKSVEHPEIANTLDELGMLRDIKLDEETGAVSFALVLPMMNIPVEIRDMILNSLGAALKGKATKMSVELAEMTDEERTKFFSLSQANWKL